MCLSESDSHGFLFYGTQKIRLTSKFSILVYVNMLTSAEFDKCFFFFFFLFYGGTVGPEVVR